MNPDYIPHIGRDVKPLGRPDESACYVNHGPNAEVMGQVAALGAGLGELSVRIQQLEERLHPVIAPAPPTLCGKDPEQEPRSPLGGELAAMNRDLRMKLRQIEELTEAIRL
jgi:hypothetical protein